MGIAEWREGDNGPQIVRLDREGDVAGRCRHGRGRVGFRSSHDPQCLVGHRVADPLAFLPRADVFPNTADRIGGGFEIAVVGRHHAPLGAIEEHGHAAAARFDPRAHRPDQVGGKDAPLVAEHLGVDRVVDERGDRRAVAADGLDDPHPPVVEIGGVIVERDPSLGLRRGDPQRRRTEAVEGLVDSRGRPPHDLLHPGEIPRVPPLPIGEGVAIGGAVGVGGADEEMVRGETGDERPHLVAEDGWESEDVDADDGHRRIRVSHDEDPCGEFTALFGDGMGGPHSPRHRQERLGGDHSHRGCRPEPGLACLRATRQEAGGDSAGHDEDREQRTETHRFILVGGQRLPGHFAVAGSSPS